MPIDTNWKTDLYKFVGKSFDFTYANQLNKLKPIIGEENANSATYDLTGSGGYGELQSYDGTNLNIVGLQRGFNTVLVPQEFSVSVPVRYKQAKVDKFGETKRVGAKLGRAAAITVYVHVLRMFAGAYDSARLGGDGVCWANANHPVASLGSEGRKFTADPDAGTYSNVTTNALSVASIVKAQSMANHFVTPDGLPFLCDMNTLLVSPDLEGEAAKICGKENKLQPRQLPGSDYNDANPVYGLQYIVMGGGNDGFGPKQWAICDRDLMQELVKIVYNTRPTVMPSPQDNPLIDLYTAYVDFACGWGDARQIIFNNPA